MGPDLSCSVLSVMGIYIFLKYIPELLQPAALMTFAGPSYQANSKEYSIIRCVLFFVYYVILSPPKSVALYIIT